MSAIQIDNPQSQSVTESFPATFRVVIQAQSEFEAPWLKLMLEYLPDHLTALSDLDWKERLCHLALALRPQDHPMVSYYAGVPADTADFINEFFRKVPVGDCLGLIHIS